MGIDGRTVYVSPKACWDAAGGAGLGSHLGSWVLDKGYRRR